MKLTLKRIILFACLILIVVLCVVAFLILNRPSRALTKAEEEQALENMLGRKVNTVVTPVAQGNTLYQGKYVSFMYPKAGKIFVEMGNGKPVEQNDLGDFSFDMADSNSHFFSEVLAFSGETFNDSPGVRLRQSQPAIYTQSTITASGQNGLAFFSFDSDNGYEMIGFFLVNGRIFTFGVQGPDQQAVKQLFNQIIPTVKFL
jgi:hypothetical protein